MKALRYLLSAGVLVSVLCAVLVACNDANGPESGTRKKEIRPVRVSDIPTEVADFLDENIPLIAQSMFNKDIQVDGSCVMINAPEELPEVIGYDGLPLRYPAIDFDSCTLILGQCMLLNSGVYLASRYLALDHEEATMNITLKRTKGDVFEQAIKWEVFWGLYPKVTATSVSAKVTLN